MRRVICLIGSHVLHLSHQDMSVIIEIDPMTVQLRIANRGQGFPVFRPLQANVSSISHSFLPRPTLATIAVEGWLNQCRDRHLL